MIAITAVIQRFEIEPDANNLFHLIHATLTNNGHFSTDNHATVGPAIVRKPVPTH